MPVSPADEVPIQAAVDENLNNSTGESQTQEQNNQGDQNNADSPAAEKDGKTLPTMADAVRAALNGKEDEGQSSGSGDNKETKNVATDGVSKEPPKEGEEDLGEITDEELKGYHSKTRRRVKQLMGKTKELETELETVKPIADRMARIDQFVAQHNLSKDDMNVMFEAATMVKSSGLSNEEFKSGVVIMEAMRNDPQRAYELLAPVFRDLEAIVGEVLPEDLRQQVIQGKITQDAARELSRYRAGQVLQTTQKQETEQRTTVQKQKDDAKALGNTVADGITKWEQSWKSRDPDYRHKATMWNDKMEARIGRGWIPKDAAEAVKVAEECKKEVEDTFKKLRPARTAVQSQPTGVGSSTGAKAVPSSMKEAIMGALGH